LFAAKKNTKDPKDPKNLNFHIPKIKVAVLGGDLRETILMVGLLEYGYQVYAFAHAPEELPEGVVFCENVAEALQNAQVVILPMPGVRENGIIYTEDGLPCYLEENDLALLEWETPILVGVASSYLKNITQKYGLDLILLADRDDIAIANAVPTAEGAIALAIEKSPYVLDRALILILGFGRVGQALAPKLHALGADVVIANRGSKRADLASGQGFNLVDWDHWPQIATKCKVIYNTIPADVITEAQISQFEKHTLIIDLAANPGGTDFTAAKKYGIRAVLASGLPGKVAPITAGELMARLYPPIIEEKIAEKRRNRS